MTTVLRLAAIVLLVWFYAVSLAGIFLIALLLVLLDAAVRYKLHSKSSLPATDNSLRGFFLPPGMTMPRLALILGFGACIVINRPTSFAMDTSESVAVLLFTALILYSIGKIEEERRKTGLKPPDFIEPPVDREAWPPAPKRPDIKKCSSS